MWLTLIALRNGIAILMASLAIVVLGATSLGKMPIDLFPNINYPSIQIGTVYKGANVQDVERTVTYPIEKAVSAVANVRYVESRSRQGFSVVTVQFVWGSDLDAGLTEVAQRIQQIMTTLPTGVQQPFILKFDLSNIPVCLVTITGGGLDEKQLYDLAYNTVEPQLEQLPGVASANVDGGKIRQITVNLNRDLLQAKGISVTEVARSVNDSNFLLPSGDLKLGNLDYNVFTNNQFSVVEPMENIIVRRIGGTAIRVRDIGRVEDSWETQQSVVRVNGERAVYLRVNKQPGGNTVDVVDAVKAKLPKLTGLPAGVNIRMTLDQSIYIRQSITSLWHEAAIGSLLAFFVVLFFLRSFVSTIIISIAIPLSLLLTLVAMFMLGQTLNVFTLGGLALAVGRLLDDSIVELENINRHLNIPGKARGPAVLDAAREVAMPIFVSTITTIVVFLPTVFLEGQSRLLFIPLTFTISFSLFASFLVSRTVTPLLCLHWLKPERPLAERPRNLYTRGLAVTGRLLERFDEFYQRVLGWALGHRARLIGGIAVLVVSAGALVPLIGTEFFPPSDESQFIIRIRAPVGTRVEETERTVARMEGIIRSTLTARGGERDGLDGGRAHRPLGRVLPEHRPARGPAPGLPEHPRQAEAQRPGDRRGGAPPAVRPVPGHHHAGRLRGHRQPRAEHRLPVRGRGGAARVRPQGGPGHRAGGRPRDAGGPGHRRRVHQPRGELSPVRHRGGPREGGQRGPDPAGHRADRALLAQQQRERQPVDLTDPRTGNQYNMVVQLDEPFRSAASDLSRLFVIGDGGRPVLLGSVAEIRQGTGPVMLERKYQQRIVKINANPSGRDLGAISADLEERFRGMGLPPGFSVQLGGQTVQQREAFSSLKFTSLLALMLVYMVMASQFKSLLDPLIIMFSVPLGMIGVIWALFLTNTTLNVTSFMGIIMMVGIVVSNGVLLVEYINELRRHGLDLHEAVMRAGRTRLRPIIMTSLTTVVGLIPMALGIDVGSEANAPLARAVIGGLTISTMLTLVLIPTLYVMLEERFPRRISAVEGAPVLQGDPA